MAHITNLTMPHAPSDADVPTFDAPWQAQAFAMAVLLSRSEHFPWHDWVRALGEEIGHSPGRAGESANETYYRQWLSALEGILMAKGLLAAGDAAKRAAEWRAAYVNTPHGQAVELAHATCSPAHAHKEITQGAPLTVSPASPPPTR